MRRRALDLFGGEGLSALGWALAGYHVVSVENDPARHAHHVRHPNITLVDGDATTYPLDGFDLLTGSPPCTSRSTLRTVADAKRGGAVDTGWMLPHTLARFQASGLPWVVENVTGARRDLPSPFMLCGTMFGLDDGGWHLSRHRWFATNVPIMLDRVCTCRGRKIIGVYGDLTVNDRRCAGTKLDRPNGDMRAGVDRAPPPDASAVGVAAGVVARHPTRVHPVDR